MYWIVDDRTDEIFTDAFSTEEEAIEHADLMWNKYMTYAERMRSDLGVYLADEDEDGCIDWNTAVQLWKPCERLS